METASFTTKTNPIASILRIHRLRPVTEETLGFYIAADWIKNTTGVVVAPGLMATTVGSNVFQRSAQSSDGSQYEAEKAINHSVSYSNNPTEFATIWRIDPSLPSVELAADSQHLRMGDELTIYGYEPMTWKQWAHRLLNRKLPLPPRMAKGHITSLLGAAEQGRIVLDAPAWLGMGGGPAFDSNGKMVGIWVQNIGEYHTEPAYLRIEGVHALLKQLDVSRN